MITQVAIAITIANLAIALAEIWFISKFQAIAKTVEAKDARLDEIVAKFEKYVASVDHEQEQMWKSIERAEARLKKIEGR